MKSPLLISLLLSTSIYAETSILNTINSQLSPKYACFSGEVISDGEAPKANDYLACLQDICGGTPSLAKLTEEYRTNNQQAVQNIIQNEIKPAFHNFSDLTKKQTLEAIKTLSNEQSNSIKQRILLDRFNKEFSLLQNMALSEYALSGEPVAESFLFGNEFDIVKKELENYYSSDLIDLVLKLQSIRLNALEEAQYIISREAPEDLLEKVEPSSLLERVWALDESFDSEKSLLASQLLDHFNKPTPSEGKLSEVMYNNRLQILMTIQSLENLTNPELQYKKAVDNITQHPEYASLLGQDANRTLKELLEQKHPAEERENTCLFNISQELNEMPSEESLQKIEEKVTSTKNHINNQLDRSGQYSNNTRKAIKAKLSALPIHIPSSREKFTERVKGLFKKAASFHGRISRQQQVYSAFSDNAGSLCQLAYGYDAGNYFAHSEDEGQFIYLNNQAVINWNDVGHNVLSHELGHVLSIHLKDGHGSRDSTKEHERKLNCLERNHTNGDFLSRLFTDAPEFFREEDFADAFSASLNKADTNLGCLLLDKDGLPTTADKGVLTGFNMDYMQLGMIDFQHSSSVYRILHAQKIQGLSLPKSCEEAMNKEGANLKINGSCFKRKPPQIQSGKD